MHFGDRNFYSDWWNANNIDTFWRSWNMPVHRWAVRHLYLPLVEQGYPKEVAVIAVFFISAFFHEYLVSVPLKTFKAWVFIFMMWQVCVLPNKYDMIESNVSRTSVVSVRYSFARGPT